MQHIKIFALLGVISGLLSYFIGAKSDEVVFLPGIIFGTIFGLYFFLREKTLPVFLKSLLWVAVSTGSYYAAVYVTIATSGLSLPVALFIGGIVGGCLMLVGFLLLCAPFHVINLLPLTFLSGLLGLSWFLGIFLDNLLDYLGMFVSMGQEELSLLALFFVWQAGMATALGWVLDQKENPSLPQT